MTISDHNNGNDNNGGEIHPDLPDNDVYHTGTELEIHHSSPLAPVLHLLRRCKVKSNTVMQDRLAINASAIKLVMDPQFRSHNLLDDMPTIADIEDRLRRLYEAQKAVNTVEGKQRLLIATLNSFAPEFRSREAEEKLWARAVSGEDGAGDSVFTMYVTRNPLHAPAPKPDYSKPSTDYSAERKKPQ